MIERALRDAQEPLAGALADQIVLGWLGGARSSLGLVGAVGGIAGPVAAFAPPSGPPVTVPDVLGGEGGGPLAEFPSLERALAQLVEREILPAEDFYSVTSEARQQAFTISGDITTGAIESIRDVLAEQLRGPVDREAFTVQAKAAVDGLSISDSHLEHVFRNATNTAFSQGMEDVLESPLVGDAFPYRAYYPIRDSRVRPDHLALEKRGLDGTNVYNARDPVWTMFRPPWDWQCRCGFNPQTVEQAAAKGVREAQRWLRTGVAPETFAFVEWPKLDGEEIMPSESWQRILR